MAKRPATKSKKAQPPADYRKKMEELLRERERTEHSKNKMKLRKMKE